FRNQSNRIEAHGILKEQKKKKEIVCREAVVVDETAECAIFPNSRNK
ncbi:hypothetical protein AVEN_15686-1, partial [Araneus ventricosus]